MTTKNIDHLNFRKSRHAVDMMIQNTNAQGAIRPTITIVITYYKYQQPLLRT